MIKLTENQVRAIGSLAAGRSKKETASAVGVTPETISHWLAQPAFEAELNRIKREALNCARDEMQALARTAIRAIADLVESAESESVRLRAAQTVIDTIGLTNPMSGLWAWGVGPATEEEIKNGNSGSADLAALLKAVGE